MFTCSQFNKRFDNCVEKKLPLSSLVVFQWGTVKTNKRGNTRYLKARYLDEKGVEMPFHFSAAGEQVSSDVVSKQSDIKPSLSIAKYPRNEPGAGAKFSDKPSEFYRMCHNFDTIVEAELKERKDKFGFHVSNTEQKRLTTLKYSIRRKDDKAGAQLTNPIARVTVHFEKAFMYENVRGRAVPFKPATPSDANRLLNWRSTVTFTGTIEGLIFSQYGISVESSVGTILATVREVKQKDEIDDLTKLEELVDNIVAE